MSAALTQIYALQQRELNEKERQRQRHLAKSQRQIAAFSASGLVDIFEELRDVPLRNDVRQRVYKSKIADLCYHAGDTRDKTSSLSFVPVNGMSSGPRWWCEENADSGKMWYRYSSGMSGDHGTDFETPQGIWLNRFIEYIAHAADPAAIETKVQLVPAVISGDNAPRRQLQPV